MSELPDSDLPAHLSSAAQALTQDASNLPATPSEYQRFPNEILSQIWAEALLVLRGGHEIFLFCKGADLYFYQGYRMPWISHRDFLPFLGVNRALRREAMPHLYHRSVVVDESIFFPKVAAFFTNIGPEARRCIKAVDLRYPCFDRSSKSSKFDQMRDVLSAVLADARLDDLQINNYLYDMIKRNYIDNNPPGDLLSVLCMGLRNGAVKKVHFDGVEELPRKMMQLVSQFELELRTYKNESYAPTSGHYTCALLQKT